MNWTHDDVQRLRTLWAEGLSGSAIARMFHVTRNSIIGKAHRLKLPARKVRSSSQAKANGAKAHKYPPRISGWQRYPKPRPKPQPKVTPMEPIAEPVSLDLSVMDLEPHQCRFPHGSGPYVFCGHTTAELETYCEFHRRLCYMPTDHARQKRTNAFYARVA